MIPNINDQSKLPILKKMLAEKNVSANAISVLEKALQRGMSFGKPEDLTILNLPALDIAVMGELFTYGATVKNDANVKTFQYSFKPVGEERFFYGYQFVLAYMDTNKFIITETFPIESGNIVYVDINIDNITEGTKLNYQVKSATGETAKIVLDGQSGFKSDLIEVSKASLANAIIKVAVNEQDQQPLSPIKGSYQIKGRLITPNDTKDDGYEIIINVAVSVPTEGQPDFFPVAYAHTETNGYFVTSFLVFNHPDDIEAVTAGKAVVVKENLRREIPIKLVTSQGNKSMLPSRLILVIEENEASTDERDCQCGACNELNFHEKKVLEEYSYYTVVRTTEPAIIADVLEDEEDVDLDEIYGTGGKVPFSVFQKYHTAVSTQIKSLKSGVPGSIEKADVKGRGTPVRSMLFNKDLLDLFAADRKAENIIRKRDNRVHKGRMHLNVLNQIDWDDEPTIYQAASISHGHLLQFKQEWMPDGYSIGDILYSLPLAAGQKKDIALLDWERRESAANSQALDYEETLNNSLVRDRDINEVVSATLNETIKGNSNARTGGIGFGLGSAVMGIIPGVGSFGSLMGLSGGRSSAGSSASQQSSRESTVSSMQSISDRTLQAASMVRSQRATVIQTVSQGERVQAIAESVANYNHCHAITIQYFEVLRHFLIQTRLANVKECLFVPLRITSFTLEKCLRWRNTLEKYLFKSSLRAAFDAVARIQHEKESLVENYYDSIGYPKKNFAEQSINYIDGQLFFEFYFFNTKDIINEAMIAIFKFFHVDLTPFKDRKLSDEELSEIVGPRTVEYMLEAIIIEYEAPDGLYKSLPVDISLISNFRQNAPLNITIRQNAAISVPRDQVKAIRIRLDETKLESTEVTDIKQFRDKYMKIKVRSGFMNYRTENFSGTLFKTTINNDLFAGDDFVYIGTPLNQQELRNPRSEDVEAANNLIHHLNENLEYYHKCIWFDMTPERRFMLLDGIIAPGKANGRSVASVVENKLIGIAGNSLIMPVAAGNQLDPTIDGTFDLFAQYYSENNDPIRVSLPTKGVYAESIMGKCNSCEEKDESKFWRWEESPIPDSPKTQILPINTDTRRADPGNLQAKDFPNPVVNIQNAPALPDPSGLQNLLQLLGKGDAFRDLTGLNQNQLNALGAFQKSLDTAQAFGKEAADLAKTAAMVQMARDAQQSGSLSNEDAKAITKKHLDPEEAKKADVQNRENEREQTKKDADVIDEQKEKGRLDNDQAKEMTEDKVRKDQGIPKTPAAPRRKTGKKKYNLTLLFDDINGDPLVGTFMLIYGSIVEQTFEVLSTTSAMRFEVELDRGIENILRIMGNPFITGLSFPADAEFYYHFAQVTTVVGDDPNLTFTIKQTAKSVVIQEAKTTSESEVKQKAVTREIGGSLELGGEAGGTIGVVTAKVATKATITGKLGLTDTGSTTTGTTDADTISYTVRIPAKRLKIIQKNVPFVDVSLDE